MWKMSVEDDLLADLLSVASEELENVNKNRNSLKEADIFKQESNIVTSEKILSCDLSSFIHKGDTDSSEDDDNRINEKKYNEFGREVKHLLKDNSNRSHREQHSKLSTWKTKVSFSPSNNSNNRLTPTASGNPNTVLKTQDVFTDPIFGIRIINPLISSTMLKERMVGREAVPFAKISRYLQMCGKDKDWVIAGVITKKSVTKTSQKGSQYCIWTLSDLKNDIKTVSLFLFSKAHNVLWKTVLGTVVGVLNPNILDKKNGSTDEACLSVDNPQKVLIFGMSKDFGICKSIKKDGEQCSAIVNLNLCEYCVYHIKQEYQKCSKRSELQANFVGNGLTALRNKVLGKNEVFYAGKSYTAIPARKNKKLESKDNHRLQSLSTKNVAVANIRNKRTPVKTKIAAGLDISQAQRLRDIELLKKLGGCSGLDTKNSFSAKHSVDVSLEESKNLAITVIDRLKLKTSETSAINNKEVDIPSESDTISKEAGFPQTSLNCSNKYISPLSDPSVNTKDSNYGNLNNVSSSLCENTKVANQSVQFNHERTVNFPVLSNTGVNSFIDLNKPVTYKQIDRAKLNAIKFVQKNGGIKKIDPNNTKSTGKKRAIEEIEKIESTPKKSKLSDNEFISDRFKKMMETTSKHVDLLECREDEEQEKYFNKLEMKEKMEEKMINTHKVSCKAVRCLKCKYTSFSASDKCKDEKHPLKVFDATKRFYKCGNCGNRTVTLDIVPIDMCKNCGSGNWQKCGMIKDKSVATHSLSIRGGEQKFVNSVLTGSDINLLVPDAEA